MLINIYHKYNLWILANYKTKTQSFIIFKIAIRLGKLKKINLILCLWKKIMDYEHYHPSLKRKVQINS